MKPLESFDFEILTGYGNDTHSASNSGICSVKVKMDATELGRKPLQVTGESITASFPDAYDTVVTPVLRKGSPAVMTATSSALYFLNYTTLAVSEKIELQLSNYGFWHGIEPVGDSLFLIADAKGKIYLVNDKAKPLLTSDLPSAHQALWDTTSQKLFVIGRTQLNIYTVNTKADAPAPLKLYSSVDFTELYAEVHNDFIEKGSNWADGGHDIYFCAGERRMYLTTGSRAYHFDIDILLSRISRAPEARQDWQLDQLFAQDVIQPAWGIYQVRSNLSDSYSKEEKVSVRPVNKGGCKSLCGVPGTSLQIAHAAPDYYLQTAAPYATNTLIVSRGPSDRPNLYSEQNKPYENLKIVLKTKGNSTTYRSRVKPTLPAMTNTPLWAADCSSGMTLTFTGLDGSLGKVGAPYLMLDPEGKEEKEAIVNLYDQMKKQVTSGQYSAVDDIYGFCSISVGTCQRDALFRLSSGNAEGVTVSEAGQKLAVYTWATPVQLYWECRDMQTVTGHLLNADNQRKLVALWISVNSGPATDISDGISADGRHFSAALSKNDQNKAQSVTLYARTDEGYWACSGERQL
jgi:hypothetical protein